MGLGILAAALILAPAQVLVSASGQDYSGPWHVEYTPAHHIRVTWEMTRECPEKTVGGWEVYGALPPDLDYQKVISTRSSVANAGGTIDATPDELRLRDLSLAHVPIWGYRLLPKEKSMPNRLTATSEFEVVTYRRRLVPGPDPSTVKPLSDKDRGLYLAANHEFDTNSKEFQAYLDANDLRRHGDETVLGFAHRVYRFVRQGMKYKIDAPFETTLSQDCQSPWGHCGNYSRRVVGIMRANNIPARMSFGHWIEGGTKTYEEGREHTRSEIYVDSVGWVLLDTSEGIPDGGWKPERDLDVGFGNDDGGFFVFHLNSSLLVPTKTWGPQPQMHLQNIYMPALDGSWEGSKTTYRLSVQEMPIDRGG
jgi:hypothetical protein